MTFSVAIQMDPLASIKPVTDTSLLLGLEAQARGYELWYYTPDAMSWREGKVVACAHRVTLHADPKHYFDLGEEKTISLADMDVILLRQDPPFDMSYITTTYLLESLISSPASGGGLGRGRPLVVNHPAWVRNLPEKWFPTLFAKYMPPTLISADANAINDFRATHGDVVIKPLYGFGGHDIVKLAKSDVLPAIGKEPVMVQKFLPEVKDQDRRIILIDGKVAATFGRIPAEGEIRANMAAGGTPVAAKITPRQQEIAEAVGAVCKEKGLLLVGLDVIGDWLTEINITSPTGLVAANRLYGLKLESLFWDAVIPA